ncbi:alginate lyase family protein [Parerythrobacter jejuensis]
MRLEQVWHQLLLRFRKVKVDSAAAPPVDLQVAAWRRPAARAQSLLAPGSFHFLNQPGDLAEIGWKDDRRELLWRYNQHYFDDLNALHAAERADMHQDLIDNWLADNSAGDRPAFDPYPTSLRLVNWCKWLFAGHSPRPEMMQSMAVQARHLAQDLEYHLLGNHLLANAKALVFAGSVFEAAEAEEWRNCGLKILAREIPEQVLPDGGNFELSTMYHALGFEDVLDLINLSLAKPQLIDSRTVAYWRRTAAEMRFWLESMCHPDGEISNFNDAALGIAPPVDELLRYADALGVSGNPGRGVVAVGDSAIWLRDSGYVRIESSGAVLLCDVAQVGPDYLPAHGHADTLSFELSVNGERLIVNGGTSCYGTSAERLAERGTRAHSTVTVGAANSSEVWGGFRVARRARPIGVKVEESATGVSVSAAHDGYARLPGSPRHKRTWQLDGSSLTVSDEVMPASEAVAQYLFHPARRISVSGPAGFNLDRIKIDALCGDAQLTTGKHSAEFGRKEDTAALHVRLVGGHAHLRIVWQPLQ